MVGRNWAPRRGDIIWLNFNPQSGREQAGRRPALVLSDDAYNRKVGLAIICPITTKAKGYPFEVALPTDVGISGIILADQLRSLDWRAREAELACPAPEEIIAEVWARLLPLLDFG